MPKPCAAQHPKGNKQTRFARAHPLADSVNSSSKCAQAHRFAETFSIHILNHDLVSRPITQHLLNIWGCHRRGYVYFFSFQFECLNHIAHQIQLCNPTMLEIFPFPMLYIFLGRFKSCHIYGYAIRGSKSFLPAPCQKNRVRKSLWMKVYFAPKKPADWSGC